MFNQNAVAIILSKSSRVAGRVAGSLFGERVKKSLGEGRERLRACR